MAIQLEDLGWSDARQREFEPLAAAGYEPGRVSLEHNHVFRVFTAGGERLAETAGRVKHQASGRHELPVVGDWVALRQDRTGHRDQIRHILSRTTSLSRKAAGRETEEQMLAANVDTVLLVFGLDRGVNLRAIERYLLATGKSGAELHVVLSKVDVVGDANEVRDEASSVTGRVPVLAVSAHTGAGIAEIESLLTRGRTFAVLGPSGAGKSSLINRLVRREVLDTGEVRDWDQRGRHTSVHRQLVVREAGGLLLDTPGMRELQLWEVTSDPMTFADIDDLGETCRFRDCRHDREPGCAVKAAVESGTLDAGRYLSFQKLQAEQAAIARKREERTQAESKRATKAAQRALRTFQKNRQSGR